jgi:hypothetical protein
MFAEVEKAIFHKGPFSKCKACMNDFFIVTVFMKY